MTTSWLHALLGITHNAKHHKKVCENKESYQGHAHYQRRMKLPGTCSISKESHKKKKKKKEWDSYFGGVGLLLFGWDSYFLQKGSPGLLLLKS